MGCGTASKPVVDENRPTSRPTSGVAGQQLGEAQEGDSKQQGNQGQGQERDEEDEEEEEEEEGEEQDEEEEQEEEEEPELEEDWQAAEPRNSIVPDFSVFGDVDEHVRQASKDLSQSAESLAEYLSQAGDSQLLRARAVYKWVTANIRFDINGFLGRKPKVSSSVRSVLRRRRADSRGFANVTRRLCDLVGIQCRRLSGHFKSPSFDPMQPLTADTPAEHAWNAVKIDGHWRFMDTANGSGYVNGEKFVKEQSNFYFLADPDIFIDAHFPCVDSDAAVSAKWQLLESPIELEAFNRRVVRTEEFCRHQVELVSHQEAIIESNEQAQLKFRTLGKLFTQFSVRLVSLDSGEKFKRNAMCMVDHRNKEATVTVRPPSCGGRFKLQVFGTTDEEANESFHLATYFIIAQQPSNELEQFPAKSSFYGVHANLENCGFVQEFPGDEGFWLTSTDGSVTMRLAITRPVSAKCTLYDTEGQKCNNSVLLQQDEEFLIVQVRMPSAGFHQLYLYSKEAKEDKDYGLLANFLLDCAFANEPVKTFPYAHGKALEKRVVLESPLDGELPAETEIQFRLKSPILDRLMIDKLVQERNGDDSFEFRFTTGEPGQDLKLYGATGEKTTFDGLFHFLVVQSATRAIEPEEGQEGVNIVEVNEQQEGINIVETNEQEEEA